MHGGPPPRPTPESTQVTLREGTRPPTAADMIRVSRENVWLEAEGWRVALYMTGGGIIGLLLGLAWQHFHT